LFDLSLLERFFFFLSLSFFFFSSLCTIGLSSALAGIQSPFATDGTYSEVAARDQQIALLQFELRRMEKEVNRLRSSLAAAQSSNNTSNNNVSLNSQSNTANAFPTNSWVTGWLGSDEGGLPISDRERRTINALVRRYLLARGYRATAVALAEDVGDDQDLGRDADDSSMLALPGFRRDPSARGNNTGPNNRAGVLTLLAMHRKRIAPIQAAAESEARANSEISSLKAELRALHEQLDFASNEAAEAKRRAASLAEELVIAKTTRGPAAPAPVAAAPVPAISAAAAARNAAAAAAAAPPSLPTSPASTSGGGAASLSLAHAPALLRVVHDTVPALRKFVVTRQRAILVPLLGAAIAADASLEARRSMLGTFLTMLRRPTYAERQLIKTQFGVLATRLGSTGAEHELLPEVTLLARNGKTKERKALAALLCGALAPSLSDKRCDGLLGTLASLAESSHAIVRVAVIDGLASIASCLSDRWSKTVASGNVLGTATAMEASSARQLSQVEFIMWNVLLRGGASVPGVDIAASVTSATEREANALAAAAAAEYPIAIPPALALYGTPAAIAAMANTNTSNSTRPSSANPPAEPLTIPQSWSTLPTSVVSAACASLVPTIVLWSYRLGGLWTRYLPSLLNLLGDTLQSSSFDAVREAEMQQKSMDGPNSGGISTLLGAIGIGAKAAAHGRLSDWHVRRVQLILQVLSASAPRIRQCLFDEGYSITFIGEDEHSTDPFAANAGGDYIFELFDFSSATAASTFPIEGSIPTQQRQALILTALLRGTTAVRRRRRESNTTTSAPASTIESTGVVGTEANTASNDTAVVVSTNSLTATTAATTTSPTVSWQPVRDELVSVQWPGLRALIRTLLCSLLRQAACVSRASAAGRSIVDAYADSVNAISAAMGPAFASYAARPLFLRALGIPLDLPPATPTVASGGGAYTGRGSSCTIFAHVLFGLPSSPAAARAALASATAIATATADSPIPSVSSLGYAAAGVRGAEWPLVLPEASWMHQESPDNPANWSSTPSSGRLSAPRNNSAATGNAPAGAPPSVFGGVWNAEPLLPMYGSALLCCPALQPRELLEASLRAFVVLVATNRHGWGAAQSLLEDAVIRAGGGGSLNVAAVAASKGTSSGTSSVTAVASTLATTKSTTGAAVLSFMLTDVLARASSAGDPAIRACTAGLLRSLLRLMSVGQLQASFLPVITRLTRDPSPIVVKAAVRALATIYSSAAISDTSVASSVNAEVTRLLNAGPKDVMIEILRALMRAVGHAAPALRDGFILDRLLEVSASLTAAAKAGAAAMADFCKTVGDIAPGDVHSAAAQAARAARAAAIQAAEPWPGALPSDLEEVAMVLCEALRAYGSVVLPTEVSGLIRASTKEFLATDLLDPGYRAVMAGTFETLFAPSGVSLMDDMAAAEALHAERHSSHEIDRSEHAMQEKRSTSVVSATSSVTEPETIGSGFIPANIGPEKSSSGWAGALRNATSKYMQKATGGSSNHIQTTPTTNAPPSGFAPPGYSSPLREARPVTASTPVSKSSQSAAMEAPTMSLSSFSAAPAPAPPARRASIEAAPTFSMSSFASGPGVSGNSSSKPPVPDTAHASGSTGGNNEGAAGGRFGWKKMLAGAKDAIRKTVGSDDNSAQ
jgi:hypothetical protein